MSGREARQWFELAFASSPVGMLLLDADANITVVNAVAARLFGWHPHELAGVGADVLVAPRSRRKLRKLRERFAREGHRRPQHADVELWGLHREGREFPLAVGVGVVDGGTGQGVLVSVADLSRRQRTENRLRDAVAQRTAQLSAINARLFAEVEERRRTESELRAAQLQLQEVNDELRRLALLDDLTGLANRRHFESRYQVEFQRAARSKSHLSLVLLDLDHFKAFNDHAGHPAGDACLRRVAAAVAGCLRRPADLVARVGGEELVALLPDTPREGATLIARAMRAAVRNLAIPHPHTEKGVVTVSAGVASLEATPTASPATLLEAADRALYTAKARGRDRVCVALPAPPRALAAPAEGGESS